MGKRCAEIVQGREQFFRNVLTLSCPERKTDDIAGIAENDISKVIENEFFSSYWLIPHKKLLTQKCKMLMKIL